MFSSLTSHIDLYRSIVSTSWVDLEAVRHHLGRGEDPIEGAGIAPPPQGLDGNENQWNYVEFYGKALRF